MATNKSYRRHESIKCWLKTDGRCWFCGCALTLEGQTDGTMFTLCDTDKGPLASCFDCARRRRGKKIEEYRDHLKKINPVVNFYGEMIESN